jgi:hypothetical protein
LLRRVALIFLGGSIYREATRSVLPNCENRGHVPTAVAVIWRGPYGGERLVKHILVAFLYKLMGAGDERKRVYMIELLMRVRSPEGGKRRRGGQTSRVTLLPKSHPAPRGLTPQFSTSSGSDHMRSIVTCRR